MGRCLLLILLSSWLTVVRLSLQCETGVAHPRHVLSVTSSLMANADVAVLKAYRAGDVDACMTDCCTEKFGSCTVVSFKKDAPDSKDNCWHFNCRPVTKCRYLSSNNSDSFSFSSQSTGVPSRSALTAPSAPPTHEVTKELEHGITQEAVATYSQFALKNDNTTIKPRKGVDDDESRKGVKPRKGVALDDAVINDTSSNVKPRKGVGMPTSLQVSELSTYPIHVSTSEHVSPSSVYHHQQVVGDDVVSALEKVFEDDPVVTPMSYSAVSFSMSSIDSTSTSAVVVPTSVASSTTSYVHSSSVGLQSSYSTILHPQMSASTPHLLVSTTQHPYVVHYRVEPSKIPSIFEHSKLLFHEATEPSEDDTDETEKERKYESSMHLVLSLVFGLLVLFVVLGVVVKRVYDGWMRRHYRRMDFLVEGMYHGYG